MDVDEWRLEIASARELVHELKQADSTGGHFLRLLDRFDDPRVRVALHAAYLIGHEDGEGCEHG